MELAHAVHPDVPDRNRQSMYPERYRIPMVWVCRIPGQAMVDLSVSVGNRGMQPAGIWIRNTED